MSAAAPGPDGPRRAHRRAAVPPPLLAPTPAPRPTSRTTPAAAASPTGTSRAPTTGGKQRRRSTSPAKGWLRHDATKLSGNNSHTYSDVNDNNKARASEEVHAASTGTAGTTRSSRSTCRAMSLLRQPVPLLVEPEQAVLVAGQPGAERHPGLLLRQQLARPPAGGADRLHRGGRQLPGRATAAGRGKGGDAVDTQTDDGANTDHGLPDGNHIDNANMDTPPDGHAPRMQMYLQHQPGTSYPGRRPVLADQRRRRGGHRLPRVHPRPVQPAGRRRARAAPRSAASRPARWARPGATGTPWTTWSPRACRRDVPSKADVVLFQYDGAGVGLDRTEPIDCKVGDTTRRAATAARPATAAATPTPTTARSIGGPEVHARRRDLGADPVGPARRGSARARSGGAGDPGDGAGAVQPVVPRHAQRDPGGRHRGLRRRSTTPRSGRSSPAAAWASTPARSAATTPRPAPDFHLPPATRRTGVRSPARSPTATAGKPARGVTGHAGLPGRRRDGQPDRGHRRRRQLHHRPGPGGQLRQADRQRRRLRPARPRGRPSARRGTVKNFALRRDWAASQRRRDRSRPSPARTSGRLRPAAGDRQQPGHRLGQHDRRRRRRPDERVRAEEHHDRPDAGRRHHPVRGRPVGHLRGRRQRLDRASTPIETSTDGSTWTTGRVGHVHRRRTGAGSTR